MEGGRAGRLRSVSSRIYRCASTCRYFRTLDFLARVRVLFRVSWPASIASRAYWPQLAVFMV
jgi:hypothetical protein